MNKALAVCLLVLCNLAAVTAAAVFNVFIFCITRLALVPTVLVALVPLIAMGYGSSRAERLFAEKFAMKKSRFMLVSHIPPAIGAAVYLIVYLSLNASGYFTGWFGGLLEMLLAVSLSATAALYPISSAVWIRVQSKFKNN